MRERAPEHRPVALEECVDDGHVRVRPERMRRRETGVVLARHRQHWHAACRQLGAAFSVLIAERLVADWRLDELVAARDMTLVELSAKVGVTVANLSILKNGHARAVRFTTLTAICDVLAPAMLVAIDGPAGAGKSTVARAVARELGVPYLDSGAMYRCVALLSLASPTQEPAIDPRAALKKALFALFEEERDLHVVRPEEIRQVNPHEIVIHRLFLTVDCVLTFLVALVLVTAGGFISGLGEVHIA